MSDHDSNPLQPLFLTLLRLWGETRKRDWWEESETLITPDFYEVIKSRVLLCFPASWALHVRPFVRLSRSDVFHNLHPLKKNHVTVPLVFPGGGFLTKASGSNGQKMLPDGIIGPTRQTVARKMGFFLHLSTVNPCLAHYRSAGFSFARRPAR